jgi:propionyl-CoA synthetase
MATGHGFWRIVQDYGVKTIFTAPTAVQGIKRADPDVGELTTWLSCP